MNVFSNFKYRQFWAATELSLYGNPSGLCVRPSEALEAF